jgi:hypothetical protein
VVDIEHGALRAFEQNRLTRGASLVQQDCGVAHERRDFLGSRGVFRVHFVGIEWLGIEERMRDHVLLTHRILDVFL